jgi:myo-inositol 2-dehydrogenase/D-chiro-inositol 1-dehydrogenase
MKNGAVQIGLAGLGRLGYIHAQNIQLRVEHAELSAVCDLNSDPLSMAREQLGVEHLYSTLQELLDHKDLDAIVLVTPSALHSEQIEQSLLAGYHVFCEKPLGIGSEDSVRAREAVLKHPDLVFMIGFMRRYDPSYQYAKMKMDEGEIGKPVLFRSYSVDPVSVIESILPYIPDSSGQFVDMAVHDIDLARWMLKSEPSTVYAIGGCFAYPEFGVYGDGDNVTALMQFKNNSMAFFYAGRTAPHGYNVETEIIGTKATLRIGSVPQKNLVEIMDHSGVRKECSQSFHERFGDAFVNEMQEFVDCIRENRRPEVHVNDGVESSRIAELATQSFKTNQLIKIQG